MMKRRDLALRTKADQISYGRTKKDGPSGLQALRDP